ncbi:MAG: hypothetical protein N3G22_03960 [Candidatus Micrarchaeota archaeon]|nr:hypothetical protein [Candidatus Micrarchaeota archaeon]
MIDEKDLSWNIPPIALVAYAISIIAILILLIVFPICAIPIALAVILRVYYVQFVVNKKKKEALAAFYNSLSPEDRQRCFLQRYDSPTSMLANFLLPIDKIEDYRILSFRPDAIEIHEFAGTNTLPTKKIYSREKIDSIVKNDLKIMRNIRFDLRNEDGKIENLFVFSHTTKHFEQMEQLVNEYYAGLIK